MGAVKNVIRFGYNRSGAARCRCLDCKKTFALSPRSHSLAPEKTMAIERALAQRIPQSVITPMFQVSPNTVRSVRQNGHVPWPHSAGAQRVESRSLARVSAPDEDVVEIVDKPIVTYGYETYGHFLGRASGGPDSTVLAPKALARQARQKA